MSNKQMTTVKKKKSYVQYPCAIPVAVKCFRLILYPIKRHKLAWNHLIPKSIASNKAVMLQQQPSYLEYVRTGILVSLNK